MSSHAPSVWVGEFFTYPDTPYTLILFSFAKGIIDKFIQKQRSHVSPEEIRKKNSTIAPFYSEKATSVYLSNFK